MAEGDLKLRIDDENELERRVKTGDVYEVSQVLLP